VFPCVGSRRVKTHLSERTRYRLGGTSGNARPASHSLCQTRSRRMMRSRISPRYLCALALLLGPLVAFCSPEHDSSGVRLLNADEGRTLVHMATKQQGKAGWKPDCSHLVHQIYELAGFPYPYASSYDLYDGIDSFRRVSTPRPGDLVVWRGHVGILTDAVHHTFYSSVTTGLTGETKAAHASTDTFSRASPNSPQSMPLPR
jgi:cell wall-associated NlpC family hydrolase